MPQQYETSCFDYSMRGYYSKNDCIFKCKINDVLHKYDKWPDIYLAYVRNIDLNFYINDYLDLDDSLTKNCVYSFYVTGCKHHSLLKDIHII